MNYLKLSILVSFLFLVGCSDSQEEPRDIRSILLSGIKYVYIVALAALLSGIFTPLTTGVELTEVIYGILSILLGLSLIHI